MTPSATASWIFNEATMSRGRYWHWFKTPWLCYRFPVIGAAFITVSIFIFTQEDNIIATAWVFLIVGIYFVFRYWIIGIRFRRDIRKSSQYGKELRWDFSDDGFWVFTNGSEMKSDWNGFYQTYIAPDGFLLYPQKNIYYWIPKSAFKTIKEMSVVEAILQDKTNAKKIGEQVGYGDAE